MRAECYVVLLWSLSDKLPNINAVVTPVPYGHPYSPPISSLQNLDISGNSFGTGEAPSAEGPDYLGMYISEIYQHPDEVTSVPSPPSAAVVEVASPPPRPATVVLPPAAMPPAAPRYTSIPMVSCFAPTDYSQEASISMASTRSPAHRTAAAPLVLVTSLSPASRFINPTSSGAVSFIPSPPPVSQPRAALSPSFRTKRPSILRK